MKTILLLIGLGAALFVAYWAGYLTALIQQQDDTEDSK